MSLFKDVLELFSKTNTLLGRPLPLLKNRTIGDALLILAAVFVLLWLVIIHKRFVAFAFMLAAAVLSPGYVDPTLFFSLILSHELGFFAAAWLLLVITAFRCARHGSLPNQVSLYYLSLTAVANLTAAALHTLPFAPVALTIATGYHLIG